MPIGVYHNTNQVQQTRSLLLFLKATAAFDKVATKSGEVVAPSSALIIFNPIFLLNQPQHLIFQLREVGLSSQVV